MQFFQSLMPMAGLVAVANAYVYGAPSNTTAVVPVPPPAATVTVVTTDYTTYCPVRPPSSSLSISDTNITSVCHHLHPPQRDVQYVISKTFVPLRETFTDSHH
jgi:hypothetical protein